MRDRLVDLINEAKDEYPTIPAVNCCKPTFAYYLAKRLLASGAILPPCKVGDTVWYLNRYHSISMRKDAVYEAKVVRVYVEKENTLCLSIQIKNEWGTTEFPRITEIGKTVFLTREEAEQALKGERNG